MLWDRCNLPGISGILLDLIQAMASPFKGQSVFSLVAKLMLAAAVYAIWHFFHARMYQGKIRDFPLVKQVDFPTSPISTTVTSILPMPLMLLISSSSSAPTTDSSVDLSSEPSLSSPSDSSAGNHTSPASANSPVDQPPLSTHSLVGSPSVQT
ncbi:unnamed protein product [Ilex paraguariensis]|uniref:Uncharacterized protein n=1 Tax=Ilex paraguariensis TaxID=185542 RepID=A0ABC8V075_9AQUA